MADPVGGRDAGPPPQTVRKWVPRTEGSFTLTVTTGTAASTVTELAGSHAATVGEALSLAFSFSPPSAVPSVQSVTPSGLNLTLSRSGDTASVAGTPTLAGAYEVTFAFTQTGRVDTHTTTVEVVCATGHTQQDDRSCTAAVCIAPLGSGTISSQTLTLGPETGTWENGCVLPAGRRYGSGTYYAKHYTFTVSLQADVTIDLTSSDQDTYLYLLEGHGADGRRITHNDDGGSELNSRITRRLPAGDYTISASTYRTQRTGDFQVSVKAYVPLSVSGLESSYDAVGHEALSFAFTYEPAAAAVSLQSIAPSSGLALAVSGDAGAVSVSGTPTLAGDYEVTFEFTQTGRVDTRTTTVEAVCPEGHTEQSDRSCAPAVCEESLGPVSSGTLGPVQGSWEQACELPASRRSGTGTYYAKHYTFTLNLRAFVTIDLTSSDQNTYLYLLRGHGPDSAFVRADNDSGDGTNSRLSDVELPAGDYTVSASTLIRERTGDFELTVRAVAPATTDLQHSYSTVVGQTLLVEFALSPAGIAVPTIEPATTPGLDVSVSAANYIELDGQPSLSLTPQRTGDWNLTMVLTQPGRRDTHPITVTATCPTDQVSLSGTCAEPLEMLQRRHYVSIWPQPSGHPTNGCYKTDLSDGSIVYTCRRIQESRVFISKTSDQILAASSPHATYGTMLTLRSDDTDESDVTLEGCQSITSDYWQCDFRADLLWAQRTVRATAENYIIPALINGVAEPLNCARAIGVLWATVASVTPDARAFTAVVTACAAVLAEDDE